MSIVVSRLVRLCEKLGAEKEMSVKFGHNKRWNIVTGMKWLFHVISFGVLLLSTGRRGIDSRSWSGSRHWQILGSIRGEKGTAYISLQQSTIAKFSSALISSSGRVRVRWMLNEITGFEMQWIHPWIFHRNEVFTRVCSHPFIQNFLVMQRKCVKWYAVISCVALISACVATCRTLVNHYQ